MTDDFDEKKYERDLRRIKLADRLMSLSMFILIGSMAVGAAVFAVHNAWVGAYAEALAPGVFAVVCGLMAAAHFIGPHS